MATIYGTAVATDFPKRAQTIAKAIADERPDLIGLQEVTKWRPTRTDSAPRRCSSGGSQRKSSPHG